MGSMEDCRQVANLLFSGKLAPVIDSVYPLADYPEALRRMIADEHFGKIVIDVAGSA